MMKVKLPVNEAQKAMSSMEEGNVGDLFANIEKMDIQAERKKTLEQKTRAEAAENRADAAETVIELMARKLIETGKIQKHTKEEVVQSMETDFQLSRDKAQELVGKYW